MEYIQDNYDLFEQYEEEQERKHRLWKRLAAEEEAADREEWNDER